MKKKRLLLALIPLLGLSACEVPEDKDTNKDPATFMELIEYGRDWECTTTNKKYPLVYNDYGDLIKDQIGRITGFERVKKPNDLSCDSFTYIYDCIECERPSITVYVKGYVEVVCPHWLAFSNYYYYTIDEQLAVSIYDETINALDHYIESEKEEQNRGDESVKIDNFFATVKDVEGETYYCEQENKRENLYKINDARLLREKITNFHYVQDVNNGLDYKRTYFHIDFDLRNRESERNDYYVYSISGNLTSIEVSYGFQDSYHRWYNCYRYYCISKTEGEEFRDCVLEIVNNQKQENEMANAYNN